MRRADGKYVGSIIDTYQTKRELNPYVNIENPDKTAHMRSLIRAFAVHLEKIWIL